MARHHKPADQPAGDESGDRSSPGVASAKSDAILNEEATAVRVADKNSGGGRGNACAIAAQQYLDMSPDIFKVKSGPYKGTVVPEALSCAIFASNVARAADLIGPGDVTIRALEFGEMIKHKGFKSERFQPGKEYPNGTYIVGDVARDGTNSRHVALVCDGRLIHTKDGKIVNQAISEKFFPGAYDRMTVYLPPKKH